MFELFVIAKTGGVVTTKNSKRVLVEAALLPRCIGYPARAAARNQRQPAAHVDEVSVEREKGISPASQNDGPGAFVPVVSTTSALAAALGAISDVLVLFTA